MEQIISNKQSLSFEQLTQQIVRIDEHTCQSAVKAINQLATLRNWLIGAYIVEYEQKGSDRAMYGQQLVERLAKNLQGRKLNQTLLKNCRAFYLRYSQLSDYVQKSPTLSDEFKLGEIYATVSHKFIKSATVSHKFATSAETLLSKMSFSHICELLTIDDPLVRYFYETECIRGTWSVRELRRQIASNLHIRIGLSEDKMKAMQLVNQHTEKDSFAVQLRQPYTFEFLGLEAKEVLTEDDLEAALITHLQDFLLEMGKGFCFEARQKRIIIDDENFISHQEKYYRI